MDFILTTVKDGNLSRNKWLELREMVKAYDGKEIFISIERKTKKRSLQQNKYWHSVCVKMICIRLRELGFEMEGRKMDEDDVHYMLCTKFLKRKLVNESTGEFEETFLQSSKLNTVQFGELIDATQKWASEVLSLYIPDPVSLDN